MINPDYELIVSFIHNNQATPNSDFTYILRMTLFRAACEADRRYYIHDGEEAKEYRRLAYELDEIAANIEHFMNDNGSIKPSHLAMILEAIILARYLILLDQSEARRQYETLFKFLIQEQEGVGSDKIAA